MATSPNESDGARDGILFAVHSAKPAGAQLVALGQAKSLRRSYALTVAIGSGPLRPPFAELGEIVRGPTRLPIWGASVPRWGLDTARAAPDAVRLAAIIRRRRLRAVVANSTVLVAPVLAARLAGVPSIVHAQEAPKSAAARRLFAFHGRCADTVVAISPWIEEAFGSPRAHVLLNPVGIPVPPRAARPARSPEDPLRLLVIGTLDRHKRQDLAVEALRRLHDDGVAAELVLVGASADEMYTREVQVLAHTVGVADRVTFAGQSDDVAMHLLRSDVLLLPAGEVTPLVLMEAMAYETPVVAARMGSIPDVVVHEQSGLLVAPDDAAAMAAAVRRLAEQPALSAALRSGARERVETHFDEAQSHERLRLEIQRLIARRPPRR